MTVKALLDELTTSRFTGYCAIPIGESITSLIFEGGICLLAEHQGVQGLSGLQKLALQGDARVDAALCAFTGTQIGVTLKLNDPCRVVLPRTPAAGAAERAPKSTSVTPVKIAGLGAKPVRVTSVRTRGVPGEPAAVGIRGRGKGSPEKILQRKIDRSDRRIDQSSLESLKTLRDSFKTDAKDLLEELNLGHLVVKGQPKKGKNGEEKR
jgi:hypothetical protein